MAARTRRRSSGFHTGYQLYNGRVTERDRTGTEEQCNDRVGEMYDNKGRLRSHTLLIRQTSRWGLMLNGTSSGNYPFTWTDWPINLSIGDGPNFSSGEREDLRIRLLASTGPLTPKVNLPLFLFELREIPRMIKQVGDTLHRLRRPLKNDPFVTGASSNLAVQFGWRPVIEDLTKLCNFAELVRKRDEELRKAHSSKGLKRRLTLPPKVSNTVQRDYPLNTLGNESIRADLNTSQTTEMWGTIRWRAKDGQGLGNRRKPSFVGSFRTALGGHPTNIPVAIWKALPWSWMIDWFYNLSLTLQANNNMLYYEPSQINIMQQRRTLITCSGNTNKGVSVSPGHVYRVVKERTPISNTSALTRMRLPYLDNFKLSILSSLAILRLSRR